MFFGSGDARSWYRPGVVASGEEVSHLPESLAIEELFTRSPDAQIVVSLSGDIRVANPAAHALFGYEADALPGRNISALFPGRRGAGRSRFEIDDISGSYRPSSDPQIPQQVLSRISRVNAVRADGSEFPVHLGTAPVGRDSDLILVAVRDMSMWVGAERELHDARHRQALAEDHERIGRELHDTVIQELFAAGMTLQVLEQGLGDESAGRVAEVVEALDTTISRIRTVIFDLRRTAEFSRGLRQRLTDMVVGLTDALGFEPECILEGPLDSRLSDTMVEQALAVAREALANVAKHAGASQARLLVRLDDHLLVELADDGRGISDDADRHSGMANLAHRAEELGGSLTVVTSADTGTTVRWTVPVADA